MKRDVVHYVKEVVARHGMPVTVISDRDVLFRWWLWRRFQEDEVGQWKFGSIEILRKTKKSYTDKQGLSYIGPLKLRKYLADESVHIPTNNVQVGEICGETDCCVERKTKTLQNKKIGLVNVQLGIARGSKCAWESKAEMWTLISELFQLRRAIDHRDFVGNILLTQDQGFCEENSEQDPCSLESESGSEISNFDTTSESLNYEFTSSDQVIESNIIGKYSANNEIVNIPIITKELKKKSGDFAICQDFIDLCLNLQRIEKEKALQSGMTLSNASEVLKSKFTWLEKEKWPKTNVSSISVIAGNSKKGSPQKKFKSKSFKNKESRSDRESCMRMPNTRKGSKNKPSKKQHVSTWYVDSGCSRHMTGTLEGSSGMSTWYVDSEYITKEGSSVAFGGNKKGKVKGEIKVNQVSYVDGLKHNLISVSQLCDNGLDVLFKIKFCIMYKCDTKIEVMRANRRGDLYLICIDTFQSKEEICLVSSIKNEEIWLWHTRFCHLNFHTLEKLVKLNLVKGLPNIKFEKDHLCSAFEMEYLTSVGITHNFSAPRTPQQNGVVERKNRTLVEAARRMLNASGLPLTFWAEAVEPLGNFDPKGDDAIFIGYAWDSAAYRVYVLRTKTVVISTNVKFDDSFQEWYEDDDVPDRTSATISRTSDNDDRGPVTQTSTSTSDASISAKEDVLLSIPSTSPLSSEETPQPEVIQQSEPIIPPEPTQVSTDPSSSREESMSEQEPLSQSLQ
ncbi:hypothetical protein OSB04_007186 [Centaurea solstitialis]|uniref:Integrase catalytic domain-containing protein n=1 Tax=Centaurea solstitialis TaxID=347529 RepID=A0AA38WT53_9ASTR|nr:hypothetical protein OSB04_007186 [Centaurea solstitialis]